MAKHKLINRPIYLVHLVYQIACSISLAGLCVAGCLSKCSVLRNRYGLLYPCLCHLCLQQDQGCEAVGTLRLHSLIMRQLLLDLPPVV